MRTTGVVVSAIIPVYNGERFLAEALSSALGQSRPPDEILVVDDGSTDRSAAIAHRFQPRVRCLGTSHAGAAAAKNAGVRDSRGDFLTFLDADDIWLPDKLARTLDALGADPAHEAVCCDVEQFVSPELDAAAMSAVRFHSAPLRGHLTSALLIRREAFMRVGWFAEEVPANDFAEWWLRAMESGLKVKTLAEPLVRRRLHRGNLGRVAPDARRDLLHLVKASLDRRRERVAP